MHLLEQILITGGFSAETQKSRGGRRAFFQAFEQGMHR